MSKDAAKLRETYDQIQMLARLCFAVPVEDARAVLENIEFTDSFMPLLDPTGWMKINKNIPGHARLVRAFVAFRQELAELIESELSK